jgi:hypothetical protein
MEKDNFLTADELKSIAALIEFLNNSAATEVSFTVSIHDMNGDSLGYLRPYTIGKYALFMEPENV